MYGGKFDEAIAEQRKVIELQPGFLSGYTGLALAQQAAGKRDDALATWAALRAVSAEGASTADEGLADLAVAEGRLSEARAILEPAIQADLARGDKDAAARKLGMLGEVELALGKAPKAVAAAEKALQASQSDIVTLGAARVLAEAGQEKRALALADELDRRLSADARMYADLVRGVAALRRKAGPEAVEHFKAAAKHVDGWLLHLALGRAYLEAGAAAQAVDELEKAEARRGEATDVFLDIVPTWRLYPPMLYHLGRAKEQLRNPSSADSFRAFVATQKGDEGPLVADARVRAGAR
jgi:tetratricopeptide (TPR) repeat protein